MSADDHSAGVNQRPAPDETAPGGPSMDRRGFLSSTSALAMTGGLAASYGTFVVMAGRFLYPSNAATTWVYVTPVSQMKPGSTMSFVLPSGLKTVIRRREDAGDSETVGADDFLALSSTCPHLGCQVHWEPQKNQFFCPCHNGAFNADGEPIAGPPKDDNEPLPQYPLSISNGILYLEIPTNSVGGDELRLVAELDDRPATPRCTTALDRRV